MNNKRDNFNKIFIVLFSLGCIALCLIASLMIYKYFSSSSQEEMAAIETPRILETEMFIDSDEVEAEVNADVVVQSTPAFTAGFSNLENLKNEIVPQNDPLELAVRLGGIAEPRVQMKESLPAKVNDLTESFWILDVNINSYRQISAKLAYQTDHLYFWIEDGVDYDHEDVVQLATVFETQIYPTNRDMFGSEWMPGVDNDDHLVIIYAHRLGDAAGYFSGTDSLMPEVNAYSNKAEMFYLSADHTELDSSYTYGVLAHEFQHMIHWNQDRNETSWLNEGLSELAVDINGFDIGGFDYLFSFNPDLQLTFWPGDDQGDSSANYGASYLFTRYLFSQFGEQAIADIVSNPLDGLASIDEVLAEYNESFNADSKALYGDQTFQNWTIANFLQDNDLAKGIYGYRDFTNLPPFSADEFLDCGSDWVERTVSQYGTDYIEINCQGDYQIEIEANETVKLLSTDPFSGGYYFWSNRGDESHMRVTQEFDFSALSAPISMNYWTWFDIERDYDYVYLTASIDGEEWKILEPSSCTSENPTGANYGCGYNGLSGGWINEVVDLSAYAGEKVTLQFEYITDAAVNGDGFVLDNISIDVLDYYSDFEEGDGGWDADGFVRIANQLPQSYSFALIRTGHETQVEKWISTSGLRDVIRVEENDDQDTATLAISGLTRYTRLPAEYKIRAIKIE